MRGRSEYESLERPGNGQSSSFAEPLRADLFAVPPSSSAAYVTDNHQVLMHDAEGPAKGRWEHQQNLDQFFTRVYEYHQRGGFLTVALSEFFHLAQFLFVVAFSTFLAQCIDYPVLFAQKLPEGTTTPAPSLGLPAKRTLNQALVAQCAAHLSWWVIILLILAALVWTWKLLRSAYQLVQAWEMRGFFHGALGLDEAALDNATWHDVLQRLLEVQAEQRLCVTGARLTELDVVQCILRQHNYLVALANKGLLPPRFTVPFLGKVAYFPSGLKWNLELLLFWSSWSPWAEHFALKPAYRSSERLRAASGELQTAALWLGLANLVLAPAVLVWQILYSAFSWSEQIKREPAALGMRTWSLYGRLYFRHFNELDHELSMRLNRAYRSAAKYQDLFVSKLAELVGRNVALVAGAVFSVIFLLGAWDEDVFQIEHMLTVMTAMGVIVLACKVFIQDENLVWCPEYLMSAVLAEVHYLPDTWKGLAHTDQVRHEFGQLFQFKASFLVEELLSPLITPFVLLFHVFPNIPSIVEFFHRFTVNVPVLGDVCSFAQMDLDRHGDARWQGDEGRATADPTAKAAHGKTEMSLVHFSLANPAWVPPNTGGRFLAHVRETAERDAAHLRDGGGRRTQDNPLLASLTSLGLPNPAYGTLGPQFSRLGTLAPPVIKGRGVRRTAGPGAASGLRSQSGLMESIRASGLSNQGSLLGSMMGTLNPTASLVPEGLLNEMSLHALYLHELHHRKLLRGDGQQYGAISPESDEEAPAPAAPPNLWNVPAEEEEDAFALT